MGGESPLKDVLTDVLIEPLEAHRILVLGEGDGGMNVDLRLAKTGNRSVGREDRVRMAKDDG